MQQVNFHLNSSNSDHSLFHKSYTNDPFRDDSVVFFNETPTHEEGESFHVENKPEKTEQKPIQTQKTETSTPTPTPEPEDEGPRSIKDIIKHGAKTLIVSAIILFVGFLAINWSAYYQIAKNEYKKATGTQEESPLMELVGDDNSINNDNSVIGRSNTDSGTSTIGPSTQFRALEVNTNSAVQQNQIPDLSIEVAPIDNRIVIPRINKNIPVVRVSSENLIKRDWGALEADIQGALQNGVVHYPGTNVPGQGGNIVITGHSSYFPWDAGRFKDVFALLHDVVEKDKIVMYYDQNKYVYEVEEVKVVLPNDIHVLEQKDEETLTLVTCTPVGTNLKRLIVIAKPVKDDQRNSDAEKIERVSRS